MIAYPRHPSSVVRLFASNFCTLNPVVEFSVVVIRRWHRRECRANAPRDIAIPVTPIPVECWISQVSDVGRTVGHSGIAR